MLFVGVALRNCSRTNRAHEPAVVLLRYTVIKSFFSALILLFGPFDRWKPVPDMTCNVFGEMLNLALSIYVIKWLIDWYLGSVVKDKAGRVWQISAANLWSWRRPETHRLVWYIPDVLVVVDYPLSGSPWSAV